MKLTFLGGADGIGASSILVETAGHRVLVDCGLRMGGAKQDPLPELRAIQDAGGLDAIVLTHAHLDHTGGLPVLHAAGSDAAGPGRAVADRAALADRTGFDLEVGLH